MYLKKCVLLLHIFFFSHSLNFFYIAYLKCVIWFSRRILKRSLISSNLTRSACSTVPIPSGLWQQLQLKPVNNEQSFVTLLNKIINQTISSGAHCSVTWKLNNWNKMLMEQCISAWNVPVQTKRFNKWGSPPTCWQGCEKHRRQEWIL